MSEEYSDEMEFDDFIDKAIDEMFVPRSPSSDDESAEAAEEGAETAEAAPEEAPEPEQEEEVDLTISWDQSSEAQEPATEPESEHEGPLLFEEPPKPEPVAAAEGATEDEEEQEEGAPRNPALKPAHQAMLSLDWEISTENIEQVEGAFEELRAAHGDNYHMESAIKLALITCKYLRASKAYATPLAIRYLNSAVSAGDVFLAERGATSESPEALTNELLGIYNDMKADANRLRAMALQQRDGAEPPAQAAATPQPTPPQPAPTPQQVESSPRGSHLIDALMALWDSMEQIRGRLRGASAQGAPFAEAIDSSCEKFQEEFQSAIQLARMEAAAPGAEKLAELEQTAQDLADAVGRFKTQLAGLRCGGDS